MKTLILGGNGFIGSHLVDRLAKEGHEILVFDKYPELYRPPVSGVCYRFGEFGNRGILEEVLRGVDIVYHLISTTNPKSSDEDPIFDIQSNVLESIFLFQQCIKNNIKKIVFVSSGGTIYGIPHHLPVNEVHALNPICSYGISKLAIEKYVEMFHILHDLDYVIVRPSNPFGPRQNPKNNQGLISVLLGKIKNKQPIELWGDGTNVRDYIYIDDLINGIYLSSTTNSGKKIFNLGSGRGLSINEIMMLIREVLNVEPHIKYLDRRKFDIPSIYLDIERAECELNWRPSVQIEEGIVKTWEFIKSTAF